MRVTLIGRPAGWRAVFPNEKRGFSAGWRAAQKTEGRAGKLHKRVVWWAAEKGMVGCRKRQPSCPPFSATKLNVQPVGPPSCAVHWPVL